MISTPVAIQKRVNTLIHQFIWNGPHRVKRSEMSANYDEGGLKMIDIFRKIKAQQSGASFHVNLCGGGVRRRCPRRGSRG